MKKKIYFILFFIIIFDFSSLYTQNYTDFETEIIKHHEIKDSLIGDDLWVYDKNYSKIKKVDLEIFKDQNFETYLVDMTWYLGYHMDFVNCLFKFDPKSKEIKFVGELWCNGFKTEFYDSLIGYSIPNDIAAKKFVNDFEKLIQINNPNVKFEKVFFENGRTFFYQTNYSIPKKTRELQRIIVLNHKKGRLTSINLINPERQNNLEVIKQKL